MENLFEILPIVEDQKLYIRTHNDVFKVLCVDSNYNYMAERSEHNYEILPDVWINEYECEIKVDTNIHNLIDEYIVEAEYKGTTEIYVNPFGKYNDDSFERYVAEPNVKVYGAIWVKNANNMPVLKSVCEFIGPIDVKMRH